MYRHNLSLPLFGFVIAVAACKDPHSAVPRAATAAATSVPSAAAPVAGAQHLSFSNATSSVVFIGAKVTGQHEGRFERFTGGIDFVADAIPSSRITVDIEMASVTIQPDRLLNHLRTPDFFDVAHFPHATFTSTEIRAGGENSATHTITGVLELHGQRRTISFPAAVTVASDSVRATSEFRINRRDFGIVYPGMPDDLIRDDVVIRLDIRAPRGT